MNTTELRELSTSELVTRKRELKDELFHLRLQKASGQLEKPSQFKSLRKEVARIETVITQRSTAKTQAESKAPQANNP